MRWFTFPWGGWGQGPPQDPSQRGHPRQSLCDTELAWPMACMPLPGSDCECQSLSGGLRLQWDTLTILSAGLSSCLHRCTHSHFHQPQSHRATSQTNVPKVFS